MQYFDWQWARGVAFEDNRFPPSRLLFTLLFLALGALGLREHYRKDRASWLYLASLFAILSVGLVYYLNFKLGYSFPDQGIEKEVRERDYFFVVGFSVWGLIAGIGLAGLWKSLSRNLGSMKMASPVLLLALAPLILNFQRASRSDDYSARDWAYNLLMSVEPYALIFTNGDNDTFPLWYLQEVEGIRRDVVVAVTSYLNTDWYVKQLRGLSRPCGPGRGPGRGPDPHPLPASLHAGRHGGAVHRQPGLGAGRGTGAAGSARAAFASDASSRQHRADRRHDRTGRHDRRRAARRGSPVSPGPGHGHGRARAPDAALDAIRAVLHRQLHRGPAHLLRLRRRSSGRHGLRRYIVRQGVAYRLWPGDPAPLQASGIAQVGDPNRLSGVGLWVDTERTRTLVEEVYVHRSGLPDGWDYWRDPSSLGIPTYYALAYFALYREAGLRGDTATANRMLRRMEAWNELGL